MQHYTGTVCFLGIFFHLFFCCSFLHFCSALTSKDHPRKTQVFLVLRYAPFIGLLCVEAEKTEYAFLYFGSRGFQFWRRSFKIASISSMDLRSPAIPIMLSFRSFTSISIKSPSSTSAIGPPSTASGLQWPITGPVGAGKTAVGDKRDALSKLFVAADCLGSIEHLRHTAAFRAFVADEDGVAFLNLMFQHGIKALLLAVERSGTEDGVEHFFRAGRVLDDGSSGARFPRRTAMLPSVPIALSYGRIISSFVIEVPYRSLNFASHPLHFS